ncbi:MAG: class I SAM-dependent methyltransferase [Candidatus Aminicenantes bacterium]|nr:class I SAM-dependent methyltransferase [Candidatus Aminicenantes bacterium]
MEGGAIGQDNFETHSTCPVCSSSALRPYKQKTFETQKISAEQIKITDSEYGNTWDLSQCLNCSHVFANPAPTPLFIQTLYSQVEDPLYEDEVEGRSKNFSKILSRLEKICPNKGTLFDVGAATGILIHLARDRGWDAGGIEPSAWAVKSAKEKYALNIKQGSFEEASLPSNQYAAVTMVDIVEHVSSPREAVQRAFEILKPGGILCLVTPNIKSLAARITGAKWWHFRPGHLGYFTAKSLQKLMDLAGFTIVKKKKYSWTFSAHYLISRKKWLHFLIKNAQMALFWKKISIKLVLSDSMEIYAKKNRGG